jgi:hypothetical protein
MPLKFQLLIFQKEAPADTTIVTRPPEKSDFVWKILVLNRHRAMGTAQRARNLSLYCELYCE